MTPVINSLVDAVCVEFTWKRVTSRPRGSLDRCSSWAITCPTSLTTSASSNFPSLRVTRRRRCLQLQRQLSTVVRPGSCLLSLVMHHSIALRMFYQKCFAPEPIRPTVWRQTVEETIRRQVAPLAIFSDCKPPIVVQQLSIGAYFP